MYILVLNAGSSSHKLGLYTIGNRLPAEPPAPIWEAQLNWHPQTNTVEIAIESGNQTQTDCRPITERKDSLSSVIETLWTGPTAVLSHAGQIDVVGHRVVHGGTDYPHSTWVTPAVKADIDRLSAWAPLHNPINLEGITLIEQILDNVPQVAVFDTAFHSQMPAVAATYPGPYRWVESGIRRYGFHGISHQYCAHRAAQILQRPLSSLRLVVCHLGNGGSLTAIRQGRSVDTTMGFTPLDGLMMGTRSGSVDPGILLHLMRQGHSAQEIDHTLNQESGLKGISGLSNDLRDIRQAMTDGNPRAGLAYNLYLYRLKSCLGSLIVTLSGLDVLVFTAGIGENSPDIRQAVCENLAFLGLQIDLVHNRQVSADEDIATPASTIRVLVIHTQEDWAIARDCWQLLSDQHTIEATKP